MDAHPQAPPTPLRAEVLAGRCHRPAGTAVAERLAGFLGEDRGALAAWFGPETATALAGDPWRCRALLEHDAVALDALIARQLDAVLHHPRLQRLEGSWRGLAWLVHGLDPAARLKVRVASARWDELARDLARAVEFDQSALFRLIYEGEFGTAGGEPFGLLVLDHELRHVTERRRPGDHAPVDDVSVLAGLTAIAAAAFAPLVVAASPALLGVDRFADLAMASEAAAALDDGDHARWRALATREDARFACVTLPRVLARAPWQPDPARDGGLAYREHAPSARQRTWTLACYAFAAAVCRSQASHGWPADVRGVGTDRVGGGLITGLPAEPFRLGPETAWDRPTLELALTDRQERDLVAAGLMPLNALPHGDAAFAAANSLQRRPAPARDREATPRTANARLSAQFNAMLCVSRFAHHVKIMGRELTGSFQLAGEIERRLQDWLAGYTNASLQAGPEERARRPLVSSGVAVHELPGRPGTFGCVIHLQPHYQLDDVAATFRLATHFGDAPAAGGRS